MVENEDAKINRAYTSGAISVLNHPIRVMLYNLIRDGINTTPKLAVALNEDRHNLYHHLNKLEHAGLIIGYYEDNRIKKFKAIDPILSTKTKIENISDIPDLNSNRKSKKILSDEYLATAESILLVPPKDNRNRKKFKKKVRELLEMSNYEMTKSLDIIQVQIILQPRKKKEQIMHHVNMLHKNENIKEI